MNQTQVFSSKASSLCCAGHIQHFLYRQHLYGLQSVCITSRFLIYNLLHIQSNKLVIQANNTRFSTKTILAANAGPIHARAACIAADNAPPGSQA